KGLTAIGKYFRIQQIVHRIARIAAMDGCFWKMVTDFLLVMRITQLLIDFPIQLSLQARQLLLGVKLLLAKWTKYRLRPIAEDDLELQGMFTGGAIHDGGGAAGVIPHHTADHGPVGRGGNGAEEEAVRFEEAVQFIPYHAWLHPYPAFFFVKFQDLGKVLRHIHHD